MILTADWHLTDKAVDAYRWEAFTSLKRVLAEHGPQEVCILGDLTEHKDKHPGELLNRMIVELDGLYEAGATAVHILMGNHDAPMRGTPYWQCLNRIHHVNYYTEPTMISGNRLMLPWVKSPLDAWADVAMPPAGGCVLMHQTVSGATLESGIKAEVADGPIFRRGLKVYSGDIHTPQQVGPVCYVGAPHHVKFGDHHQLRMLVVQGADGFKISDEIEMDPPEKLLLELGSMEDFGAEMFHVRSGAQVKIRMNLTAAQLTQWAAMQREMHEHCAAAGIRIDSIEAVMVGELANIYRFEPGADNPHARQPMDVFTAYCTENNIDPAYRRVGEALLERTLNG